MNGKNMLRAFLFCGLIGASTGLWAESGNGGQPGDEFRSTAQEYEQQAERFFGQAGRSQGKTANDLRHIGGIYREMAAIKRNAARLADQNRWEEIHWDRYYALENQKEQLKGGLGKTSRQKNQKEKAEQKQTSGFVQAARDYQVEANRIREKTTQAQGSEARQLSQLADIFDQLAQIKREAAQAERTGRAFNWDRYHRLSERKDRLQARLQKHH